VGVLLVVILAFIVVLCVFGFAQRYLTSAVTTQTFRSSIGDLALQLAQSGADEALYQLGKGLNDPTSPIFLPIRKEVYGDQVGDRDFSSFVTVPHLLQILKDPNFAHFSVKELHAHILYQSQFVNLAYERFGLLKVSCRVQYDVGVADSISREVEVGTGFKINMVGPPRPFDQSLFLGFIADPQSALNYSDVNVKKREYAGLAKDIAETAEKYANLGGEGVRGEYNQILSIVQPLESLQGKIPDLPTDRIAVRVMKPTGFTITFDDLYIWKKLEDKERAELAPAKRTMERAMVALSTNALNPAAHRELINAMKIIAQFLKDQFKVMVDYPDTFDIVKGGKYDELDAFRYKLELKHWAHSPNITIQESPSDPAESQLKRLFAAIHPLNTVIRVDNPNTPLNLDGINVTGKEVIVTGKGGVRLANVNKQERDRDLLTVICIGGTVTLEGDVHAAVISADGHVAAPSPARIQGLLVLNQLPGPAERSITVTRQDKYFTGQTTDKDNSGAFVDYYYVGLNPKRAYKKVNRR
jgi:hypothetical protein